MKIELIQEMIRLKFKILKCNLKGEYYLSQGYQHRYEILKGELKG